MSATAALVGGRKMAESLMLDTCAITRPGKPGGIDPDTGLPTPAAGVPVWSGRCKVQSASVEVLNPSSGAHTYSIDRLTVHIPVSATGVKVGDTLTITASPTDPAQADRIFRVTGLFRKTFATAQRLSVEEVVS